MNFYQKPVIISAHAAHGIIPLAAVGAAAASAISTSVAAIAGLSAAKAAMIGAASGLAVGAARGDNRIYSLHTKPLTARKNFMLCNDLNC